MGFQVKIFLGSEDATILKRLRRILMISKKNEINETKNGENGFEMSGKPKGKVNEYTFNHRELWLCL